MFVGTLAPAAPTQQMSLATRLHKVAKKILSAINNEETALRDLRAKPPRVEDAVQHLKRSINDLSPAFIMLRDANDAHLLPEDDYLMLANLVKQAEGADFGVERDLR